MGELLQLMRRPVAEVQGPRGAKLERVATRRDVVKVQLRAAVNQPEHDLHIFVNESICLFLDEVEELDIFEQCHLDSLRDTTAPVTRRDRKSTRLNSSHPSISYAVFCLKKKKKT